MLVPPYCDAHGRTKFKFSYVIWIQERIWKAYGCSDRRTYSFLQRKLFSELAQDEFKTELRPVPLTISLRYLRAFKHWRSLRKKKVTSFNLVNAEYRDLLYHFQNIYPGFIFKLNKSEQFDFLNCVILKKIYRMSVTRYFPDNKTQLLLEGEIR